MRADYQEDTRPLTIALPASIRDRLESEKKKQTRSLGFIVNQALRLYFAKLDKRSKPK